MEAVDRIEVVGRRHEIATKHGTNGSAGVEDAGPLCEFVFAIPWKRGRMFSKSRAEQQGSMEELTRADDVLHAWIEGTFGQSN